MSDAGRGFLDDWDPREERDQHVYGETATERIEREEEKFWRFAERPLDPREEK